MSLGKTSHVEAKLGGLAIQATAAQNTGPPLTDKQRAEADAPREAFAGKLAGILREFTVEGIHCVSGANRGYIVAW